MPLIRDAFTQHYVCTWAENDSSPKSSVKFSAQQYPILRKCVWHGYAEAGFDAAICNSIGAAKTEDNNILTLQYQGGEQVPESIFGEADVERLWNHYPGRVLSYAARRYAKLMEEGQLKGITEMSKAGASGHTNESTTADQKMVMGRQDISVIEFKRPWFIRTAEWGMINQEGSSA